MASMSSVDPVAYVIERYLETYPDSKPINPLDFRVAVEIVTELVNEQLLREATQNELEPREGRSARRKESRSSSMLDSVFTAARQHVLPENTPSKDELEQVVALQNGASMYGQKTCDLMRMGFPFATVSAELSRKRILEKYEEEKCYNFPNFNVLCQDFYITPPCVRRVNLNVYSPILVIGDLIIGLYEGKNKRGASETLWTCVAFHIKTEEVVWTQPLHLNNVQDWVIFNTSLGIAIPKQDSNEIEFYDVATGMKNGAIELPKVYNSKDKLYLTPDRYVYYYCNSEQKLFGAYCSSFSSPIFWGEMDDHLGVASFSGHFIIFKNQDAFALITPSHTKHSFLECQHLSLFGRNLVRFERREDGKMEVIIQEIQEGSEFVLSLTQSKRYTVSFGYIQQVGMVKDLLIYSTIEGICFVNLQNDTFKEIKCPISYYYTPLLIDPEIGVLWMWDRTKRSLYKVSQEGLEYIDQLTSSGIVKLLCARDDKLYIIG